MRLDEGVVRELHWHKEAEWAYVLDGSCRITAIDYEGGNFIDDVQKGDLWYVFTRFPLLLLMLNSSVQVLPLRRSSLPSRSRRERNRVPLDF